MAFGLEKVLVQRPFLGMQFAVLDQSAAQEPLRRAVENFNLMKINVLGRNDVLERQAPQVQLSALGAQKVQFCYLFKDMLTLLHLQVCDDSLPVCYSYLISP